MILKICPSSRIEQGYAAPGTLACFGRDGKSYRSISNLPDAGRSRAQRTLACAVYNVRSKGRAYSVLRNSVIRNEESLSLCCHCADIIHRKAARNDNTTITVPRNELPIQQ